MNDHDELQRREHKPRPAQPLPEPECSEQLNLAIGCQDGKVVIDLGHHGGLFMSPEEALEFAILVLQKAHLLLE
jgi:hypothetical protein